MLIAGLIVLVVAIGLTPPHNTSTRQFRPLPRRQDIRKWRLDPPESI